MGCCVSLQCVKCGVPRSHYPTPLPSQSCRFHVYDKPQQPCRQGCREGNCYHDFRYEVCCVSDT